MSAISLASPLSTPRTIVESEGTKRLSPEIVDLILHEVVRARDEDFLAAKWSYLGDPFLEHSAYLARMRLLSRSMERIAGDGRLAICKRRLADMRQHE